MSAKITIPFNALPEATRLRFAAATNGTGVVPLKSETTSKIGAYIWWVLVALSAIGFLLAFLADDFGTRWRPLHGADDLIAYVVGFFVLGYAILAIVRRVMVDKVTPYRRGRYVFGTDVVKATDGTTLTILPFSRLDRVDVVHQHQNGRYVSTSINFIFQGGARETVAVFGRPQAQAILDSLARDQRAVAEAAMQGDGNRLAQLDVFFDVREGPLWNEPAAAERAAAHANGQALASKVPFVIKWASLSALGFAVLALPTWGLRNSLSDDASFAAARQANTSEAFQRYLETCDNHTAEAEELLFMTAFQEAQATGTVTALRDYINQYPNSPHLDQVRGVMHQRFEVVKATFLAQAATTDPAMPAFMSALLAWLEANNSPPVQVRFSPPDSATLSAIDATLAARSANVSPIAPHFTAEVAAPRETQITEVFQRGFRAVFPEDVMSLVHAGRVDTSVPGGVPTFDIQYAVRPSGATFTDESNGREFVGIHVEFNVSMHIPGDPTTHRFTVGVQPPSHFTVSYQDSMGGPSDGVVYSTMARLAFEQLSARVTMTFFRPGTEAFTQAAGDLPLQEGSPGEPAGVPAANGCDNTCNTANDNECDDGGPGSLYNVCALGTDCADCGPRTPGAAPPPVPPGNTANAGCTDTCNTANDGECDDGGPNSLYAVCALGTDCADCGPR